jgi:GAF domain-containing protein
MAEELYLSDTRDKKIRYEELLPQIKGLVGGEPDQIANLANVAAALRQAFGFFWVGFYIVRQNELVLGPFQGPIACTRISHGKGVCGTSWAEDRTILVEDVEAFPGHIACSSESRSEIVVPVHKNGEVYMVLDVDSDELAAFDDTDKIYLEKIMKVLEDTF